MDLRETRLPGLHVVSSVRNRDHRGSFARWFCVADLASLLQERRIAQINHSVTHSAGALRGMHFQYPPAAEMKLVRCIRGAVFDVAIDLRQGSESFLRWHGETLTADSDQMLVIPEGFAHGFQALEEESELLYLHTHAYSPLLEGGVRFDDPALGIEWPLRPVELSDRDLSFAPLSDGFDGVKI